MRVILLRHGPAGERDPRRWPDDGLRPLTPRGEVRTRRAVRGLCRLERDIARVLTSPLLRCTETATIVHDAAKTRRAPEVVAALAPRGSWRELLRRVAEEPPGASVVLVGHEPDLGKLAGVMLFGAPAALGLKKAGACAIDFEDSVTAGAGRLRWFLPPRVLARVGASRSTV